MIDPELREEKSAISPRILRQFAGLWLTIFGAMALWNAYSGSESRVVIVPGAIALAVGLPGLLRPSSIRLFFVGAIAATMPIGRVVSYLLLAMLYYLVFTPIALVFRVSGRDVLSRRRDESIGTFWVKRKQSVDPRRYLHQA